MKICIVGAVSCQPGDPVKQARIAFFRQNYNLAKAPGTIIDFLSATGGIMGMDMPWEAASSAYVMSLNGYGILESVVEAARRGYDAIIIHCGHDPSVYEAKQAVDIPVVGLLESAATMATLMGGRYGVVLIDDDARWPVGEAIHRYGLGEKLVSMRAFPAAIKEQKEGLGKPDHGALQRFISVTRELIADGAEVVLTACSGHSPMTRLAIGGEDEYPHGLTEVDGVPIVDMLSSAVKMAELQVGLKRAGSPWISRKGLYHLPSEEVLAMTRHDLPRVVPSFWVDEGVA